MTFTFTEMFSGMLLTGAFVLAFDISDRRKLARERSKVESLRWAIELIRTRASRLETDPLTAKITILGLAETALESTK